MSWQATVFYVGFAKPVIAVKIQIYTGPAE